jgi:hypothetical protein
MYETGGFEVFFVFLNESLFFSVQSEWDYGPLIAFYRAKA